MHRQARSLLQTAALFASGQTEPVAETRRLLEAVERHPGGAIFTLLTPERALREAGSAALRHRAGRPASLLDGVAVAWKDLFDFAGLVTTAGSRVLDEGPAKADAEIVARLAAAGAVTLGRANMTEFAFSGIGLNPHFGTPVNPWSPAGDPRAPGGSSSGSAVAVAAGLVPIAIGTDTGGSVRLPAALNGVVGYKTSGGRWPMRGTFPLSESLDTLGVFSRSVVDAVIVDAAARGLAAPDLRRGAIEGLRLIVPTSVVLDDTEAAVLGNFEAALRRLETAGVLIERRPFPIFDEVRALTARHGALVTLEAFALHKERLASPAAERMDRRVVARIRVGETISAADAAAIRETRRRLVAEAAALMEGHCLVAFPTVPRTAPPIAALEADDELFIATNIALLRSTLLGNFLDWCGVSIPNGLGEAGLPTGFLLSGGPGRDDHLLSVAMAAEPVIRGEAG
ncbi:MAG TPA: amidase [Lichenihabitans sp.]|nr:amidase [Lichenihabitans sp.]